MTSSVVEPSVLVLAEKRCPYAGQGVRLEEFEAFFERVVDVDLTICVENGDTASAA